ncbi:MAG: AzlD domain-containing protein [Azospirillum sp.]|nr:AzlD domain-containing protein [Azospirillum sp.]
MTDSLLWLTVLVGALTTYFWRALGVALSGRMDPAGALFEWVGCVAYALLAGLVARMILLPIGVLQATPLSHRIIASAVACAVFFLTRRSVLLGVGAGVGTLILLAAGVLPFV